MKDNGFATGIRGIFSSRFVFAAAAFATLGGTLFGYESVDFS